MGKSLEEIKKIASNIKHRLNLPISKGSNHPFSSWQKSQDDISPLWDLAIIYCVFYICLIFAAGSQIFLQLDSASTALICLAVEKRKKVQFPKAWRDTMEYEWHAGRQV